MDLPDPVCLALHLIEAGAPVTVVGGAAAWLQAPGRSGLPRDLDVLLEPADAALAAFDAALLVVGARSRTRAPRRGLELARWEPWQLRTGLGGLDVFVLRNPAEEARAVVVGGVDVPVAVRARPPWALAC